MPYMKFLSVGSDVCRRLPSDSTSRWTPLPWAIAFPLLGWLRDLHPLDNAHDERTTAQGQPIPPPPNNYLAESILVTLFCCMPFGVMGINKAARVGSLYSKGRYQEAQNASRSAKKWSKWGFLIPLSMCLLVFTFFIMMLIVDSF